MLDRRQVPLVIATVVVLLMLFSPGSTVPSGPENSDKVTHALMFAALAFTSRYARIGVGWTATWLLAFAAVSEVLQGALPIQRSGSVWDAAADAVGIAIGLMLARVFARPLQIPA
ncbi:VanZ family protein [Rhodococcus sp. ABRD24]|uniref:VanZ family protein n=1 Tax=Rhodococcus sp. ABRD24 TaxID=2507582 RepID=UPI00103AE943|nr:VanZ family protein [Rhodococcus sp. ABRD24]QBJ95383.1 VanZ family protein [Rhodococcus sp. ABRD24]